MKYNIHPDFLLLSQIHPPLNREKMPSIQRIMRLSSYMQVSDQMVKVRHIQIPAEEGRTVSALLFVPKKKRTKGCLLYCHGGGYAFPAAPYQYRLARIYAGYTGCSVLFPDYRLAPQNPFPAAPEDCFAAYRWLLDHNPDSPIAVCGDSAGGTLAMAVCLMAIDQHIPVPCAQLLTYPAAGDCGETESIKMYTDTPMCSSRDMEKYGDWYVPDPDAGKLSYRSPIEAESFEGIPVTYIETAEFDCLRDGAILYAKKLRRNGIRVKLYNTKGTVHGYDMMLNSRIVKSMVAKRIRFLNNVFSEVNTY